MSDLLALRARLESLGAQVRPPSSYRHRESVPAACVMEETPDGPVAVRRESLSCDPDDRPPLAGIGRCFPQAASGLDRPLFLDVETTGLAGGTGTVAFLIGLAWPEEGRLSLAQYFLVGLEQERALLWAVGQEIARHGVLVTYNGRSFDWPLLQTRLIMARRPASWPQLPHLDLLTVVRRLYRPRLPDGALRTVEQALLAITREDELPGALVPARYAGWLRGGAWAGLDPVFRHNRQDVATLAVLLTRLDQALQDPATLHPLDRFGRARFLESIGFQGEALLEYRSLWSSGFTTSRGALGLRLARLLRRARRWQEARAVLEECWTTHCYPYPAAIELAKLLEHQARDVNAAWRLVSDALNLLAASVIPDERRRSDLERRRQRLEQRLQSASLPLALTG